MNRRTALQQLAILTGGMAFIPSCSFDADKVSIALNNLKIKASQEKLLAEVVDTIIPATDIPGAKVFDIHHFVLVMTDDCQDKPDQETFIKGLDQFEPYVEQQYDKSFMKSDQQEREAMLTSIMQPAAASKQEVKAEEPEFDLSAIRAFLSSTKRYTIHGYMMSQYIMTEVFPYQLVPGHFKGCVPVSQVKIM